jgi:hypothetical protein
MRLKEKSPATLAADRARKSECSYDNSNPSHGLQELRARFIARRLAISPDLAILIATIALGEVRA